MQCLFILRSSALLKTIQKSILRLLLPLRMFGEMAVSTKVVSMQAQYALNDGTKF